MGRYASEMDDYDNYMSPKGKYTLYKPEVLERILSNCLSAQVKREDAPCSSETHLNTAIVLLSELVPDYEPQFEEAKEALEWAIKEGKMLRGEE